MPPQQNYQNYQQVPGPGMPMQGNNIFAPNNAMPSPPHKPSKLPIFLSALFLITTILFATLSFVFYNQMVGYRDDYQTKATIDINKATEEQKAQLSAEFQEIEKLPTRAYQTQSSAASIKIVYPKTWDLYANEDNTKGVVSNWFNENYVPDISNKDNTYSLRLEYIDKNYTSVAKSFDSAINKGTVKVTPYKAPNVSGGETGVKLDGEVRSGITGSMIILPVRDKTLQLWTESDRYIKDFNEIVLNNLTYSP